MEKEILKNLENKLLKKYYKIKWGKEQIDSNVEILLIEQIQTIRRFKKNRRNRKVKMNPLSRTN